MLFNTILEKAVQASDIEERGKIYRRSERINFYLVCETFGNAATPDLLCQPRMIVNMIVEKQLESRLTGEIKVLGENLPQRHFCPSQNPT
jgi:hypothetical protein